MARQKLHPNILLINDKIVNQNKFSFQPISKLDIEKDVQFINPQKITSSDSISPKILKISSEPSTVVLHNLFNDMLKREIFLII